MYQTVFTICIPSLVHVVFTFVCQKMESAGVQELYSDDMRVWNALFQLMIRDFASAQEHGIDLGEPNGNIYPIILGNKGDWSYLVPW